MNEVNWSRRFLVWSPSKELINKVEIGVIAQRRIRRKVITILIEELGINRRIEEEVIRITKIKGMIINSKLISINPCDTSISIGMIIEPGE